MAVSISEKKSQQAKSYKTDYQRLPHRYLQRAEAVARLLAHQQFAERDAHTRRLHNIARANVVLSAIPRMMAQPKLTPTPTARTCHQLPSHGNVSTAVIVAS